MNRMREVEIQRTHGLQLEDVFRRYSTVRICRDLLREYIFERPFIASEDIDQRAWRHVAHDMLDQAMTLGITIVRVRPGEIPTVIPWSHCRVTIEVDRTTFAKTLRVYSVYPDDSKHGNRTYLTTPIPDAYVLDVFGFSPTPRGHLTSLLSPIHEKIKIVFDQLDCMLAADRARSRPPVLTETVEDAHKPAEEVQYDYFADVETMERNQANMYVRNSHAMDNLADRRNSIHDREQSRRAGHVDHVTGLDGADQIGRHVDSTTKSLIDSVTPMPIGQKVARGPDCMAPENITDRLRFLEQEIFVLLGVPRSFCMHDMTVRHDAGMLHCTFTRTVHMWQATLADALSYLYSIFNLNASKRRKRKRQTVESMIKDNKHEIRFERMPRVSVPELAHAYDRGILKWEGFRRLMSTFCGVDEQDLESAKDPWTREERLMGWTANKPTSEFNKDQGRNNTSA